MRIILGIANQKGGVGKTSLALNLGVSLARMGYRVLTVDADAQANLTMALGCQQPDELPITLPHIMNEIINNGFKPEQSELIRNREYILHSQGIDFIPSNIELAGIENLLINTMSRENVLKKFINYIKDDYDWILCDTMPSLNFVTINVLNAANKIIIPTQPEFFSAKGLELLLSTIKKIKETLNPNLEIEGVLVTMYDNRLNFHREVVNIITDAYSKYFRIFDTKIPKSIKVTETQARSVSIFEHDPNGRIAESYLKFAKELIAHG